jgi:hypothetical protein
LTRVQTLAPLQVHVQGGNRTFSLPAILSLVQPVALEAPEAGIDVVWTCFSGDALGPLEPADCASFGAVATGASLLVVPDASNRSAAGQWMWFNVEVQLGSRATALAWPGEAVRPTTPGLTPSRTVFLVRSTAPDVPILSAFSSALVHTRVALLSAPAGNGTAVAWTQTRGDLNASDLAFLDLVHPALAFPVWFLSPCSQYAFTVRQALPGGSADAFALAWFATNDVPSGGAGRWRLHEAPSLTSRPQCHCPPRLAWRSAHGTEKLLLAGRRADARRSRFTAAATSFSSASLPLSFSFRRRPCPGAGPNSSALETVLSTFSLFETLRTPLPAGQWAAGVVVRDALGAEARALWGADCAGVAVDVAAHVPMPRLADGCGDDNWRALAAFVSADRWPCAS